MTEITNRRLFTLSILTACLLPPTLVTGFFGMNTKDMPFQNTDGGTWWPWASRRRQRGELLGAAPYARVLILFTSPRGRGKSGPRPPLRRAAEHS